MVTRTTKKDVPPKRLIVPVAAQRLSVSPDALRKLLERNAFKARDGGIESKFNDVRGRKLGGHWRVALGPSWTQ